MTTCQIRRIRLFNKVLETTWVFSIISTVKLCLVYTVLNIYLSTSVASIKREPPKIRRISCLLNKTKESFWDFDAIEPFRIEWNARPNSYRDFLKRGYCVQCSYVHLTVSKLSINALVKGITCCGIWRSVARTQL